MKQILFILISLSFCSIGPAQKTASASKSTSTFTNQECPHLIFKIGNGMSRIPAIEFKSQTEARVEMSDFSKTDYVLQRFTITILSNETHTFQEFTNEGNIFTEKTKTLVSTVKPKDVIMISGISAVDPSGVIIYVQEINFGIH